MAIEKETALEKTVAALVALHGLIKINLQCPDGPNEGVWAVPTTEEYAATARDDSSSGDKIAVRLANQPLDWGERHWGDIVIAETMGENRPVATLAMQKDDK